jgi:hypothetical protein
MPTECNADLFGFAPVGRREVVGSFDGGSMTSDAGVLLLRQTDRAIGVTGRLAACFHDRRCQEQVEHSVETMVMQRVFGNALGYEDINDHDELRHDPIMAVSAGKLEAGRANCAPVAGKSTLNRFELGRAEATRYHKISHDPAAIESLFVTLFLEAHKTPPAEITIDLDATDDPLHGNQEGRFFHGYYDCFCYLPLYIFCGRELAAKLRPANIDAAAGSVEEVARIVAQIRTQWPDTRIILRGDSGFAREALMAWCEDHGVYYIFGLAGNVRLADEIAVELAAARQQWRHSGRPARQFKDFTWRPRKKAWSRERRVIAKAEWTQGEANPRFVVTSLTEDIVPSLTKDNGRHLYESIYCARGEMENRLKECQIDLFADRTSTRTMAANQLRLWFASMSYVLVNSLRRLALQTTDLADATCGTIRRKLFKISALVTVSVRRIKFAMASGCPYKAVFATAHRALCADTT